MFVVTMILPI